MRVKELLTDDDAVSPVIGVILMVAITVILAAVIASFVLGLGDSADEVQPNTSFTFDYDNDTDVVTVTLSDGEALGTNETFIRGDGFSTSGVTGELGTNSSYTDDINTDGTWDAGESIDVQADGSDYTLNIVWESVDTDDSSRLQTDEGPDA
jgi:flagellin-like protein